VTKEAFRELMGVLGCCLLGICCPPQSAEQQAAFVKFAAAHGIDATEAADIYAKLAA
jgi:hypothetical protein